VGITTKTIPLSTVPSSVLELRDGTWFMTGSCVMKDAVVIKENYGHSLDRLQVLVSFVWCQINNNLVAMHKCPANRGD